MAIIAHMFQAIRNRILHGPRREIHVVVYTTDTDNPGVASIVKTEFVEEVGGDKKKWDYNRQGPKKSD